MLPSLVSIQQDIVNNGGDNSVVDIVYSRTYMPPQYMLALPSGTGEFRVGLRPDFIPGSSKYQIHDLGGKDLRTTVEPLFTNFSTVPPSTRRTIHLVSNLTKRELVRLGGAKYEEFVLQHQFWPHFSGEQFRTDLTLRWYKVHVPPNNKKEN